MKPQALVVQKSTSGTPISSAASRVKLITPSDTTQETGGESLAAFKSTRSSRKGARQVFIVDSHSEGISCVPSRSEGGRPSGMDLNRKSGRPLRDEGPLDFNKRW